MQYCQYKGSCRLQLHVSTHLTHSTLLTCTRSGAAKSTPTVNGTGYLLRRVDFLSFEKFEFVEMMLSKFPQFSTEQLLETSES